MINALILTKINDLLTFFRQFPGHIYFRSAPDEPARVTAGQITCPQDTQTLLDLSCTQYFQIQLRLIIPLIIAGWICSW